MVFHTALLHIREFTSQQKKWDNEPVLMKFTDFTMFSYHPEVSGLKEWFEDLETSWVTIPCRAEAKFFRRMYVL